MTLELLKDYVECGREIEFKFKGKRYSITYTPLDQEDFISFCEFYKTPTNVKTFEELLKIKRENITVSQMWELLTENDAWIY